MNVSLDGRLGNQDPWAYPSQRQVVWWLQRW